MEKRFYLGIGILTVFLVLGLVMSAVIENASRPVSRQLEQASQSAAAGNLDAGVALAQQAKNAWHASWRGFATVADHTPMDEIDSLFAQVDAFAAAGDSTGFSAYCARLAELVEAISDAHRLSWWNLL